MSLVASLVTRLAPPCQLGNQLLLPFEADAYKRYKSPHLFADDIRLYRHATVLVASLLEQDCSCLFTDKSTLSPAGLVVVGHLLEFYTALHELTNAYVVFSKAKHSACLLYEYHPYIELLQEFALRYLGYTAFDTAPVEYRRITRPSDAGEKGHTHSLVFQLWNVVMELQLLDELRQKENTRYTERQLRHICLRMRGALFQLRRFWRSPEAQRYLILRRNSHNSVFDKTLTYLSSIARSKPGCFLSVIELQIDGSEWTDGMVRDVACSSRALIRESVNVFKLQGLIGHAWRLDTARIKTDEDIGLTAPTWRLRWMVIVSAHAGQPRIAAEQLLGYLSASACKVRCQSAAWGQVSGRVVQPMTLLMTSNTKSIPAVVDSSVMPDGKNAADPQAQINEWVSELVAGDFYRRIRILRGVRPSMCGRGHAADGRVAKKKPVPWSKGGDTQLHYLWRVEKLTCIQIGEQLGRSEEEIIARLVRLEICQSHAGAYVTGLQHERLHSN